MKRSLRMTLAIAGAVVMLAPTTAARAESERGAKPHFVAPYSSSETEASCYALDPGTTCSADGGGDEVAGRIGQSITITSAHDGLAPNGYFAGSSVYTTISQTGELRKAASAVEVTMSVTVNEGHAAFQGSRGPGREPAAQIQIAPRFYNEACGCTHLGEIVVIADSKTGIATTPGTELLLKLETVPNEPIAAGLYEVGVTSVSWAWLNQGNSGSVSAQLDLTVNWIEVDPDYSP